MEQIDHRCERDLPELREWLNRLLRLADQMPHDVTYSEDDHLGFMALCFLSKQIDHARSVLALIPGRDAVLIARSMIEGLGQLLWAANEPDVLPLKWRSFACVHDWRVMQGKVASGEPVDQERRSAIEEALRNFGEQFLTREARQARDKGRAMPVDPYCKNWRSGRQIGQICESVGGQALHRRLYAPFSDWQHWGVAGLGRALTRQDTRIVYSSLSASDSAATIATAFQCLLQTAEIVDKRLAMGLAQQISELKSGYVSWHGAGTSV